MTARFEKDQKVAVINVGSYGSRLTPAFVEKVTKTRLTIRYAHGYVSKTSYIIRENPMTSVLEGRHARSSYMYYKEHVEPWTEGHDARVAERSAKMDAQRKLNQIKDRVSQLHVSETDLIAKLASLLGLDAETV